VIKFILCNSCLNPLDVLIHHISVPYFNHNKWKFGPCKYSACDIFLVAEFALDHILRCKEDSFCFCEFEECCESNLREVNFGVHKNYILTSCTIIVQLMSKTLCPQSHFASKFVYHLKMNMAR